MAEIGEINRNQQRLVEKTRMPGTDHNQYVWKLHCEKCGAEYGANGIGFSPTQMSCMPRRREGSLVVLKGPNDRSVPLI